MNWEMNENTIKIEWKSVKNFSFFFIFFKKKISQTNYFESHLY